MVVLPRRCQPLQPPVEKQLLRSQPSHHLQEKAFRRPVIPLHLPTQAPTWYGKNQDLQVTERAHQNGGTLTFHCVDRPLQRQHMILTEHKAAAINMEQMQTLLGLCTTNNSNTISKVWSNRSFEFLRFHKRNGKVERCIYIAAGQWNQQWPGYAGQTQPQYQYPSAQQRY